MNADNGRPGLRFSSRWTFNTMSLLSILVVAGAILWNVAFEGPSARQLAQQREELARTQDGLPSEPITLHGAAVRGDPTAKIALIVFSDFQCPFCAKLARDTFPALEEHFVRQGKVLMAFRQFPLEVIHPFARKAAEAAECAGRQGKFWQMHNLLFDDQKHLDEISLRERALQLGLDLNQFVACLGGQAVSRIEQDIGVGKSLNVVKTPTILIGLTEPDGRIRVSRRITGFWPANKFESMLADLARENHVSMR